MEETGAFLICGVGRSCLEYGVTDLIYMVSDESWYLMWTWRSAPTQINPKSLLIRAPDTSTRYIRPEMSLFFIVHEVPPETYLRLRSRLLLQRGHFGFRQVLSIPEIAKQINFKTFAFGVVPIHLHPSLGTSLSIYRRAPA